MRARIPLGRFGKPEELSDLAAFLLSDLAAWMTGAIVTLDGGEALAAGGQFNELTRMSPEALRSLLGSRETKRPK